MIVNKTTLYQSIFLIFVTFFFASAQYNTSRNNINSLLNSGDSLSQLALFDKSLPLFKKAKKLSIQIGYQEGVVKSDFKIARNLHNLGNYKDSFDHLNLIETEHKEYINHHPEYQFFLIDIIGKNYLSYDFKREAAIEFKKLPKMLHVFKNKEERLDKAMNAYICIASCYEFVDNDSAYFYMRKAASIIKTQNLYNTLKVPKIFQRNVLSIYRNLADYKLYFSHDMDSAYYYSNKTLELGEYINSPYMYLYERQRSQILHSDKKYKQSLDYSFSSLKRVNEKRAKEDLIEVYRLIAGNYRELGDKEKSNYYMAKYDLLRDSLVNTRKEGIIVSSDYMKVKKQEKELLDKKQGKLQLIIWLTLVIIFCSFVITMIFRNRIKEKKLKNNIELEKKKLLEKENETQQLKNKVKDGFDDVVLLAKKNNPEFVTRFIEIYPEFYQALLKIYPDINTENLKFCALLRLNFSTKDIAAYNFITPRAIQLRKNRLRKRLNISSTEDIYAWMNNLDK